MSLPGCLTYTLLRSLPTSIELPELNHMLAVHFSVYSQVKDVKAVRDNNKGSVCAFIQCEVRIIPRYPTNPSDVVSGASYAAYTYASDVTLILTAPSASRTPGLLLGSSRLCKSPRLAHSKAGFFASNSLVHRVRSSLHIGKRSNVQR